MSSHYRFYPLPRPSLKSDRSSRSSMCSCNPPCNGEVCNSSRNYASSADGTPYPPQPPSPHVHFLGLYQTYLVDYEYDRSSTVVMPNDCALPARGCPGKTYFTSTVANVARQGRRLTRCATPGASRANSRSRNNMSPPPSPSFYTKHIFYPDEYPFPSPIPSPRVNPPALVPDTSANLQSSDDSDTGLCTPPEAHSQAGSPSLSRKATNQPSHTGSQIFIDAPGHPPIPGLMSPSSPRGGMADMFAITNALNGLDMNSSGGSATNGLMLDGWSIPGNTSPKKVKTKKSKTSLSDVAEATRRARIAATASWTSDQGVLGGF
jgi:hypothetical protein